MKRIIDILVICLNFCLRNQWAGEQHAKWILAYVDPEEIIFPGVDTKEHGFLGDWNKAKIQEADLDRRLTEEDSLGREWAYWNETNIPIEPENNLNN